MIKGSKKDILQDKDFLHLSSQKNSLSLVLTVIELVVYYGFIILVAYKKDYLAQKFSGVITVGIPIAVGTILISWVLTGIYIYWANNKYDAMVEDVKKKLI